MSYNATNVEWAQPTEDALEIRVPVIIPAGSRAKELSVSIADGEVVVVQMKEVKLWQCRLHAAVERDIEWYVDNETTLVLDVTKKVSGKWPGLLNMAMKVDDSNFLTSDQLDEFMSKELPPLPLPKTTSSPKNENVDDKTKDDAEEKKEEDENKDEDIASKADDKKEEDENKDEDIESKADEKKEEDENKDSISKVTPDDEEKKDDSAQNDDKSDCSKDLDMLLDEAADEINESKAADEINESKAEKRDENDEKTEETLSIHHEAELKGIEIETKAILSKMEELEETLKTSEEGSDDHTTTKKQLVLTGKMLEIIQQSRTLRAEKSTVANFIKILNLDLSKSRINIGIIDAHETEEYQTEAEKTLDGHELFLAGMQALETVPIEGVHLLRLAAIHKSHTPSVIALFSIYSNVPASYVRGASLLLLSATREEVDMKTNSKVGDLFCAGARSFPPLWTMAVYFHQRAAALGSVHSIVCLATLYHKGECFGNSFMPESVRKQTQSTERMKYFIDCAIERGSVAAYLQRALHHTEGSGGVEKDLKEAKSYFERACLVEPSIKTSFTAEISPGVTIRDIQKRIDEGTGGSNKRVGDDIDDKRLTTVDANSRSDITPAAQAANKRLVRFEQTASAMPSSSTPKKGGAAGGAKARARWEGAVRIGVVGYALYTIAFPLRLIMLPMFNEKVDGLIQMFGLRFLTKS